MHSIHWVCFLAVFVTLLSPAAMPKGHAAERLRQVAPFTLSALDGTAVSLATQDQPAITVVVFLGTECPLVRLYAPHLSELSEQFSPQGVRFIGVDSNCQDSTEDLQDFVAEFKLPFPVAKDHNNVVADQWNAQRMSEVFVLDHALRVTYHGRIDDRYRPGVKRPEAEIRDDLRIALEELLADKPVSVAETSVSGCLIGRVKASVNDANAKVTYCRDVVRILRTHCVECHQAGEIGPFALTDYDEVIGWADTMLEVIDEGRMPPWHANPDHGHFANARVMSEVDKQMLRDWVAAGVPYGRAADLPPPLPPAKTWQLARDPDMIIAMRDRPFIVPAQGTVEYQYFVVDPGFTEDKWVTGAQVIPGNRAVDHHCLVFVRPPDGHEFRGVSWLTAYVPGQRAVALPPGHGRHVPAGSSLVFQMHYTPNGVEQADLTRVGLLFADESEITHEVFSQIGLEQEFEIPPYEDSYTVTGAPRSLPEEGKLLAVAPHMHLRGKSFRLVSRQGNAESILVDIPRYDFNWQHVYVFAEPLSLESLGKLEFRTTFDNSASNPVNPDPTQHVTWGDQTWEEMAVAFFEIAVPRKSAASKSSSKPTVTSSQESQRQEKIERFVAKFFRKFDENQDGWIDREEMPLSVEEFGFWQWDENTDGRVTRVEIERAAAQRDKF